MPCDWVSWKIVVAKVPFGAIMTKHCWTQSACSNLQFKILLAYCVRSCKSRMWIIYQSNWLERSTSNFAMKKYCYNNETGYSEPFHPKFSRFSSLLCAEDILEIYTFAHGLQKSMEAIFKVFMQNTPRPIEVSKFVPLPCKGVVEPLLVREGSVSSHFSKATTLFINSKLVIVINR